MAWQFPQSFSTDVTAIDLTDQDSVFIDRSVYVGSGDDAIIGGGTNQKVMIKGSLAGWNGIILGDISVSHDEHIHLYAGGTLFAGNLAIGVKGYANAVIIEGRIDADLGISIWGPDKPESVATTHVSNSGEIHADRMGVFREAVPSTETVVFDNSGLLDAPTAYGAYGDVDSPGIDIINNTGRIIGDINLGSGNDRYSGAAGQLSGTIHGQDGNDRLMAGADNDRLYGDAGNDTLSGGAGNDRLDGGADIDLLIGGAGRDSLFGGAGADHFTFKSTVDSGARATERDTIGDFSQVEGDVIDLAAIDANTLRKGNQAFRFIDADAFSHHAGELRVIHTSSQTIVYGDVDGDGKADMSIALTGSITLTSADFTL